MRDVVFAIGFIAVFVGILLLPVDAEAGSTLAWQGALALLIAAPIWWPGEDEELVGD